MASNVDAIAWAEALDCTSADELGARLDGLCRRVGTVADEVSGLLRAVVDVPDDDVQDLTARASVLVEGVYAALDRARRHVQSTR